MYNEQIERLINLALVDGELTEKEKQVLLKKAVAAGIDIDEFEIVLEAKLFEKQISYTPRTFTSKSDKIGDIRKCPACGAPVQSFAIKCLDCGTEFRNLAASQNIIKFFEKLDEIESKRKENFYDNRSSHGAISFGKIIKWLFFWYILLPLNIINFFINKSKPPRWSLTDSRKEELILSYPVPASREEILEFLTLASSRINSNTYSNVFSETTKYKNKWNKIWLKKIEQIHSKAFVAMKHDKKSFDEVDKIAESAQLIVKRNNKRVLHITAGFVTLLVILSIWVFISNNIYERKLSHEKELKIKAENYIKSGEYYKAEEVITSIENESFIVDLKSKIQLEKLKEEIDALEIYLDRKEFSKLKFELEKITWTKISKDYNTERIERDSYRIFLKLKEAINNQLPEDDQIHIESEYSL